MILLISMQLPSFILPANKFALTFVQDIWRIHMQIIALGETIIRHVQQKAQFTAFVHGPFWIALTHLRAFFVGVNNL